MTLKHLISNILFAGLLATAGCSDTITVEMPSDITQTAPAPLKINAPTEVREFRGTTHLRFTAQTAVPVRTETKVTFSVSEEVVESYNEAHSTAYPAFPEECISFASESTATIYADEEESIELSSTISSDRSLDPEVTYALGVRATTEAGDTATTIVLLRDLTTLPDCNKTVTDAQGNKTKGITLFSCMEINDTNPLNNLRYRLSGSGKYMVDAVVLFSANIHYDGADGKVDIYCNPNVQHILNNRDKYLRPLHDRGIRVLLGLLCNHDRACVANLSEETARSFARRVKAMCDAYELDGVFYDDEYCEPLTPAPEGFVTPGVEAFSRLAYEVWKQQPERWNVAYVLSNTSRAVEIEGTEPGTFLTHALHDYGGSRDLSASYPGMERKAMGLYSQEFARGIFAYDSQLRSMRQNGYGSHMVFAMDPFRANAAAQDAAMRRIGRAFYDDDLLIDNDFRCAKDW